MRRASRSGRGSLPSSMAGLAPSAAGESRTFAVGETTRTSGRANDLLTRLAAWYGRRPPTSTPPIVTPPGIPT